MKIIKTLINPAMAKEMLEKNVSNRNVRHLKVNQYANEMLSGRWKEDTFEFIKISKNGNLIDGQHRLLAIIKSNVGIWMQIAYDVPDDVYSVLDTGVNRNTGDVFKIEGIKYATANPAIIKLYDKVKNNKYGRVGSHELSNFEVLDIYHERPEFWQLVCNKSESWNDAFAKILPSSWIGGFYAHFLSINTFDAKEFMDQLCTGRNIKNETITLLRNTLIKDKLNVKKTPRDYVRIYIIKTWNAYRTGTSIKVLKFNPETDKYPIAI